MAVHTNKARIRRGGQIINGRKTPLSGNFRFGWVDGPYIPPLKPPHFQTLFHHTF